jgi:beta-aspartyl-peptidase (threonine type)
VYLAPVKFVYVHGGVSGLEKPPLDLVPCAARGAALGAALDAVETAVVALEDHPRLNAGFGATLNRDGDIELDAALADGATGRHGGVVGVRVKNPISLARRVLLDTPHVLMAGEGAMDLARDLALLDSTTPEQVERYRSATADGGLDASDYAAPEYVDTVGAVALDAAGRLAAGSSTGGVFGKLPGRVGDSAIPGAGTYASGSVAVVGTGVGEAFLETLACFRVAQLLEQGAHPQEAVERTIALIGKTHAVSAGLLALDRDGRVGAAYRGGSWDIAGPEGALDAVKVS